ncbi:M15 family metallopeptidase [Rummeliibacillus stabekisii]|uniref:M15 family metallopeptidase n=1 Tax=Rummeliibacillus stabekisii TaxID=241244 RepID=UPI000AB67D2D|nr:M15 family metallopeptidase [Rummeliibacillus stabekisii]
MIKKHVKKSSFAFLSIAALAGSILAGCNDIKQEPSDKPVQKEVSHDPATEKKKTKIKDEKVDAGGYIIGKKLPKKATYMQGFLVASKQYPLPASYAPGENPEARDAFSKLNAAASLDGFHFDAFSTYRSYDRQVELYNAYVKRDGKKAADRYSARPGYSEHQTGLAFDIGEVGNEAAYADNAFGKTEAGKWLAKNAHKYGFIMRYPKGKETVTGYMHESWHFRYVGPKAAKEIYKKNETLEEYLGIK